MRVAIVSVGEVSQENIALALPGAGIGKLDVSAVVQAIAHDKKRVREGVPFVLLRAPGDVRFGQLLPAEDVRAAVAELAH